MDDRLIQSIWSPIGRLQTFSLVIPHHRDQFFLTTRMHVILHVLIRQEPIATVKRHQGVFEPFSDIRRIISEDF
jgi:hypothetical protein